MKPLILFKLYWFSTVHVLLKILKFHWNNFSEVTAPIHTKIYVDIPWIDTYQVCSNFADLSVFSRFIEVFYISFTQLLWRHCTYKLLQILYAHTLRRYLPILFKLCWFSLFFKFCWSFCNISFTGKWLLWSRCTNSIQILCGHTLSRYLKNLFKLYLFKKFSSFLKDFNISSRRRLKLLLQFTPNFIWTYLDCVPTKFVQILQTLHLFQVLLFLIFFVNDFFTEGTTSVQGCFSKKCDGASSVHGIYTGKYMVDRDIEEIAMTWRGDQKRIWYILELGHQVQKKLNFYLSNLWSIYNF